MLELETEGCNNSDSNAMDMVDVSTFLATQFG